MIRYLLIFGILCLLFTLVKMEIMLSGIVSNPLAETRIIRLRFYEILSAIITGGIALSFMSIFSMLLRKFLIREFHLTTFSKEEYENIIKEILVVLSTGITCMIFSMFFNYGEIQQFGKQILNIKSMNNLITISESTPNWKIILSIIWECSVLTSCFLISIRLYKKLEIKLVPSILVGVLVSLCLSLPYFKEIKQSVMSIVTI
jgi:hypothetical protein